MNIPTPKERPDLYDDYDGLADGRESTISAPVQEWVSKRIADLKAGATQAKQGNQKPDDKNPA